MTLSFCHLFEESLWEIPIYLRFLHPDSFYRDYRKRYLKQTICWNINKIQTSPSLFKRRGWGMSSRLCRKRISVNSKYVPIISIPMLYIGSNAFNLRNNTHLKLLAVTFLNMAQNNPLLRGEDALASGVCSSLKKY